MTDVNNVPHKADSLDEQLNHASEELITFPAVTACALALPKLLTNAVTATRLVVTN